MMYIHNRHLYPDGSVILWDIRDLNQKEHKTLRVNIDFDHASHVAWSPDSKAFIIHTVRENCIVVYKIEKKKDGAIAAAAPVITFDKVSNYNNNVSIIEKQFQLFYATTFSWHTFTVSFTECNCLPITALTSLRVETRNSTIVLTRCVIIVSYLSTRYQVSSCTASGCLCYSTLAL